MRDSQPARPRRDDCDDRPDPRRKSGGTGLLIPLLLLGGLFVVVLVVGGIAFGRYRMAQRAQQAEFEAMKAEEQTFQIRTEELAPKVPPLAPKDLGGGAAVTLTNLRRERGPGGLEELVVDYQFTIGFPLTTKDVLIVETPNGRGTIELAALADRKGTLHAFPASAGLASFAGRIEVWYERTTGSGLRETTIRISNKVTLD